MSIQIKDFSKTTAGQSVKVGILANDTIEVHILSYGATIQQLLVPDRKGNKVDVVLGYPTVQDYELNTCFLGAVVGRYANRIGGSKFTLYEEEYHVTPNEGKNCLHSGLHGFDKTVFDMGFEGDDGNEATDPCTPHLRAIDGVNPMDRCFRDARLAGVTTVLTGPGSANPISGQFVAMKTAGRWLDDMVIKAPAAMKLALGENPKLTYHERHEGPITRMATAAVIRENLAKAVEYRDKLERAAADPDEEKPEFDAKLEALLPVVRRELPVHIHAHRADDIATGIRICKEFGLEYVIVHGTEGHLIANELAREGARVITGPCLGDRSKPELANMSLETPVLLAMAGVKIAICTDHPETPVQYLPLCAAMAVKGGLPADAALAAITIWAAEIGGVAHRVGSLTPGKDGDVVVMSGHPLNWLSRVSAVVVDGRRVTE